MKPVLTEACTLAERIENGRGRILSLHTIADDLAEYDRLKPVFLLRNEEVLLAEKNALGTRQRELNEKLRLHSTFSALDGSRKSMEDGLTSAESTAKSLTVLDIVYSSYHQKVWENNLAKLDDIVRNRS